MAKTNLERPIQLHFHVTERERDFIHQKMKTAKIKNQSAYLRKMAIDGYIINVDFTDFRQLFANVGRIAGSVNQVAKRINTTDNIYADDVVELQKRQEETWRLLNEIHQKLP
jgi:hypothetical protein